MRKKKKTEKRKNENSLDLGSSVKVFHTRWTAISETSLCCPEGPARVAMASEGSERGPSPGAA